MIDDNVDINMGENKSENKSENKKPPCTERKKVPCTPRPITLDLCTVRRALNKVAGTLCNPDYEKQMTEFTRDSVNNSLETLQKLTQLSCRLSCLDRKGWDCLINCSIDELMSANLDFNHKLIKLLQDQASSTIGILEENLDSCQKEEEDEEDEEDEEPGAKIPIQ